MGQNADFEDIADVSRFKICLDCRSYFKEAGLLNIGSAGIAG